MSCWVSKLSSDSFLLVDRAYDAGSTQLHIPGSSITRLFAAAGLHHLQSVEFPCKNQSILLAESSGLLGKAMEIAQRALLLGCLIWGLSVTEHSSVSITFHHFASKVEMSLGIWSSSVFELFKGTLLIKPYSCWLHRCSVRRTGHFYIMWKGFSQSRQARKLFYWPES
jgi:hypothetical protein